MRSLLLIRPEPGLSASAERARSMGMTIATVPLFDVVPVPWAPPPAERFDGLLLTSANTVRHAGPGLANYAHLPVHAVGAATAEAARQVGFTVASVGNADAAALLADLPPTLRLFHPGGRHRAGEYAGHDVTSAVAYEARAVDKPRIPDLSGWVVAIHSPRAGHRLAELVADRGDTRLAAISDAAGHACGPGWRSVDVADNPSDESLLALAAKLCQTDGS